MHQRRGHRHTGILELAPERVPLKLFGEFLGLSDMLHSLHCMQDELHKPVMESLHLLHIMRRLLDAIFNLAPHTTPIARAICQTASRGNPIAAQS